MYGRRHISALLRSSLSAPALGSTSPAQALRVWYTRSPVESPGAQHSESSSPTTSLLLHMWGYDQAHAPPRSGRAADCPDLILSGDAATPQWLGITSDQSLFRKVTGLVFALAVLACCVVIMLSAGRRLRPREVVDERASVNSAMPIRSPVRNSPPVHFRRRADGVEGGNAGIQAQASAAGAGFLLPEGNNARIPEKKNLSIVTVGSAVAKAVSGRLVNPAYVVGETGGRRVPCRRLRRFAARKSDGHS
ncbi:hypothetical protein MTO96_020741 [Rhipicephalus appendiculatus]